MARNLEKIDPIFQAFGLTEPDYWIEVADDTDAVCFMYGDKMISIKLGKHIDTVGVYIHEHRVNSFDLSKDYIHVELAAELENYLAFCKIDEASSIEQKIEIYSNIIAKYIKNMISDTGYFERLKVFHRGFLLGYTTAFTGTAATRGEYRKLR